MPEVHPAIAKKIEELFSQVRGLTASQQNNLDILLKVVDLKDVHGLKLRIVDLREYADRVQWLCAQLDSLRNMPYDMAAEELAAPRRRSSSGMPSMTMPPTEKKE